MNSLYSKRMKTKLIRLTENAINDNIRMPYTTLRDTQTPLYFRYNRDRQCGTFFLVKRPGKNAPAIWYRLGNRKQLNANQARNAARRKLVRLSEERPVFEGDSNAPATVHALLRWYQSRREKETAVGKNTRAGTSSNINRAIAYLPDVPHASVSKSYVDTHLYLQMMSKYKLSTFEATLKTVKAAYAQAIALELIEYNPFASMRYADFSTRRPKPRLTRLDDSGIVELIKQLKRAPFKTRMLGVWLLLHGSRIGEVCMANMERIHAGRWEIREDETKNGRLNVIPITPYAQSLLDAYRGVLRKKSGYRGRYLFAQKKSRRKPVSANHASNMIRQATNGKISAHDIRKRARTWWLDNGVDYFVGELLLGHKMKDLDEAYIQTYAHNVCLEALNRWHDHLQGLGLHELIEQH